MCVLLSAWGRYNKGAPSQLVEVKEFNLSHCLHFLFRLHFNDDGRWASQVDGGVTKGREVWRGRTVREREKRENVYENRKTLASSLVSETEASLNTVVKVVNTVKTYTHIFYILYKWKFMRCFLSWRGKEENHKKSNLHIYNYNK